MGARRPTRPEVAWNVTTSHRERPKIALLGQLRTSVELESLLLASEERFRVVFENSTAAIAVLDLTGFYRMVNAALCEIVGYHATELVGKDFLELTHPDDIELSRHSMEEVLVGPVRRARFTKRYLHRNGNTVWTDVSTAAICSPDGQPVYL